MDSETTRLLNEVKAECRVNRIGATLTEEQFDNTHPLRELVLYTEYLNRPEEDLKGIAQMRLKTIRFLKPFGIAYDQALTICKSLKIKEPEDIVTRVTYSDLDKTGIKTALKADKHVEFGYTPEIQKACLFLKAAANRGEDYDQYLDASKVPTEEEIKLATANFEAIEISFKKRGFDLKLLHNLKQFDGKENSWKEWSQDALRVFSQAGCLKVVENKTSARQQPEVNKAVFHTLFRMLKDGLCKSLVLDSTNKDSGHAVWKALLSQFANKASDQNRHMRLHHRLITMNVTEASKFLTYLSEFNSIVTELESAKGEAYAITLEDGNVFSYLTHGVQIKDAYFLGLMNAFSKENHDLTKKNEAFKWRDMITFLRDHVLRDPNSGVHDVSSKPKKSSKGGKSDKTNKVKESEKDQESKGKHDSGKQKKKPWVKVISDETWAKLSGAAKRQYGSKGDYKHTLPVDAKSLLKADEIAKVKKFVDAPVGTVFQVKRARSDSKSKQVKRLKINLGTEADETKGSPSAWIDLDPENI